jgi:hypothetical protein
MQISFFCVFHPGRLDCVAARALKKKQMAKALIKSSFIRAFTQEGWIASAQERLAMTG